MVIEVRRLVAGVMDPSHHMVVNDPGHAFHGAAFHVGNAQALAILIVGALVLVCGGGAAPQEISSHAFASISAASAA